MRIANEFERDSTTSSGKVQKNFHGEPFPVHETVNVLDARTIEKNQRFWQAVVLYDTEFSKRKTLAVYLWQRDERKPSGWKRKHKMLIKANKWEYLKESVEELLPKSR